MKKIVLSTVFFGATAFAAGTNFKVSLSKDSVVDGKPVKAGTYEVSMGNGYAALRQGRFTIEVPAREETEAAKATATELLYNDKTELEGIRFGGTSTAILFGVAPSTDSGL